MTYDTDERLKSYLDTNQLSRERMCLAVLAIDRRFSEVRHRQPRGGPDGGRDIEALYKHEQVAFAAVGFVNQANDSAEQKARIKAKFDDDLTAALKADPKPEVFVFFTNVNFTIGEKEELNERAREAGIAYCDIFDRERIRISLDAPDGFSIRFQYLRMPLSEEEQASFFARWGDEIESLVASGFQRLETALDRMLFLQEASDVLATLTLFFELDREYSAREIGHFRAFCLVALKEIKHNVFFLMFGSSDKATRMYPVHQRGPDEPPGIGYGISGGQWELHVCLSDAESSSELTDSGKKYKLVRWSSSIGMQQVRFVKAQYDHDEFIRLRPRLTLKDLDQAMIMPVLNCSLGKKVKAIHCSANGYSLLDIKHDDFWIDESTFDLPEVQDQFTEAELADPWVRIRPSALASSFSFVFSQRTPKRLRPRS